MANVPAKTAVPTQTLEPTKQPWITGKCRNIRASMTMTKAKLVFLGDSGVGKTSVIMRQDGLPFEYEVLPTMGATYLVRTIQIANDFVQLQIWDTAGQERFRSMVPMYLRNAKAAFVVYDVTERQSFLHVEEWIADIYRWTTEPLEIIILGNKRDLSTQRQVSHEEGLALAKKLNLKLIEVSALQNLGLERAFNLVAEQILLQKYGSERAVNSGSNSPVIRLDQRTRKKKCCQK